MWAEPDTPDCLYDDTIDCRDCGYCKPSPYDLYIERIYDDVEKLIYPKKEINE